MTTREDIKIRIQECKNIIKNVTRVDIKNHFANVGLELIEQHEVQFYPVIIEPKIPLVIHDEPERWEIISDYPSYAISSYGRVKSLANDQSRKEKFLKQSLHRKKDGYLIVKLSKKDITKQFLVHRLVAMYFVPNPYNKPQVNHDDRIKTNNYYKNLRWMTHNENVAYSAEMRRLMVYS